MVVTPQRQMWAAFYCYDALGGLALSRGGERGGDRGVLISKSLNYLNFKYH